LKFLLIDDHPIVRSALRRLLAAEPGADVREAASGREGLAAFKEGRPDLVILDLNLPGLGGLEVIGRLKAADPTARVLVLSMHDDEIHVSRALQAGAAGYISKNAPADQILDAIRRVAEGKTYIEHDIAERLVFANIRAPSLALEHLSSRDLEILRLLAGGCNLSRIADTIGISYKTAANNCSQIKAKLGATSAADLIRIAIRSGLTDYDFGLSKPLA
jgi:two-component system, NarL family, invasion response regulator UvrY